MTSNTHIATGNTITGAEEIRAAVVGRIRQAHPGKTELVGEASPSNSYVDIGPGQVQSIEENTAAWLASRKERQPRSPRKAMAGMWGL